jgi:density-regulated protein DRP1
MTSTSDIPIEQFNEAVTIENKPAIQPVIVTYCDTCRFPVEYCEYSHPVLYKKEIKAEERKEQEVKNTDETKKTGGDSQVTTETTTAKPEEKKPEKEKKKKEAFIEIEVSKRGGKKHCTYVSNLEKHGLNMKDIAKLFSKKFACSSSVGKEDNGEEFVQLTGEFGYEIVDFLVEKFPGVVKPELCKIKEAKKK